MVTTVLPLLSLAAFGPTTASAADEGGVEGGVVGGVLASIAPAVDFDACKAPAITLPADTDTAKKAVLAVSTSKGFGSAVVVTPSGMALTAAHVVDGMDTVTVRNTGGLELDAEVVWTDDETDLALIDVQGKGHACLAASTERLVSGADVFAIGSPADKALAFSVSKGVTSGYPEVEGRTFLQTDASINPGNSGGPLLGADGTVAAIVSWKVAGKEFEGLGFGVPIEVAKERLKPSASGAGGLGYSPGTDKARVSFTAAGEGVTIAIANDRTASATTQYGNINVTQTDLDDICIAPCDHTFKPGVYNIVAYGDDWEAHRTKVDLRGGDTVSMAASPRPARLGKLGRGLVGTGFTAALVGGTLWGTAALLASTGESADSLESSGMATTVIGGIMIGGGYGLLGATKADWETEKK